jgi:polyisoprenoid-binding protein YceI
MLRIGSKRRKIMGSLEEKISLTVFPRIEGPLARLTPTPVLGVRKIDGSLEKGAIRVEIDVGALHVISPEIAPVDRAKIEHKVKEKLLASDRFPKIVFVSSRITRSDANTVRLEGELSLAGQTRPLFIELRDHESAWEGETRLRQREFGLTPLSAFAGALRAADEVRIGIKLQRNVLNV